MHINVKSSKKEICNCLIKVHIPACEIQLVEKINKHFSFSSEHIIEYYMLYNLLEFKDSSYTFDKDEYFTLLNFS